MNTKRSAHRTLLTALALTAVAGACHAQSPPSPASPPQPCTDGQPLPEPQVGPHGPGSVPGEAPPVGRNPAETPPSGKLVAFPHPLITEVLYAVPAGAAGDADRDGNRSATGDEFIELTNPHDKPIDLRGYRLRDALSRERGSNRGASQIDFTFPALTLQPGEVVVVFNGFESGLRGDVGTHAAAAGKHAAFDHAYVFTMACASSFQALSNTNDSITLLDPQGRGVQRIAWDHRSERREDSARPEADKHHVEAVALEETAPKPEGRVEGSIARRSVTSALIAHTALAEGQPFSPGRVQGSTPPPKPSEPPQRYGGEPPANPAATPANTTPAPPSPR